MCRWSGGLKLLANQGSKLNCYAKNVIAKCTGKYTVTHSLADSD